MKKRIVRIASLSLTVLFAAVSMALAKPGSEKDPSAAVSETSKAAAATAEVAKPAELSAAPSNAVTTATEPNEAEMMAQMMELAKTGDNHKLLAEMAGSWTYTVKMWMDPTGKPQESKGTATRKAIMDGRFFIADHMGKFQMPGADGKMKDMNFKGMAIEGYDNVKKKFIGAWIDNMGTMILNSEGTYDADTKSFTYHAECEMMPGMRVKIREVIKVTDKDHHMFEWYEDRGKGEARTMEISYTRSKK